MSFDGCGQSAISSNNNLVSQLYTFNASKGISLGFQFRVRYVPSFRNKKKLKKDCIVKKSTGPVPYGMCGYKLGMGIMLDLPLCVNNQLDWYSPLVSNRTVWGGYWKL